MVSKTTEEAYATRTMETPEGRAFYPYSDSPGYLVDARTERYVKWFIASQGWVFSGLGALIFLLPWHFLLRLAAAMAAGALVDRIGFWLLLWQRPRTKVRLEAKHKEPGDPPELTYHDKYRLTVLFFAALTFLMFGVALSSSMLDKWLFGLAAVAFVTICLYASLTRRV